MFKNVDWSAVFAKLVTFLAPITHSLAAVVVSDPGITNPYVKAVALGISGIQMAGSAIANSHLTDVAVQNAQLPVLPPAKPVTAGSPPDQIR